MAKYIISDGDISNNVKLENDSMFIQKGGSADKTNVCDQSILNVSNGGLTGSTTVSSGGTMNILKGGSADCAFLYDDGRLVVSKGGFVGRAYLNGSGTATVCKGALADTVNVSSGGFATLSGTVAEAGVFDYGRGEICGGTIGSALVTNHGSLVLSKGTINSASVYNDFDVYKGGTANNLKIERATMTLYGGTVNDATLSRETYLYVYKGATANNVTVNSGCSMTFFGGKATGVTVQKKDDKDTRIELNGGSINDLTVNGGDVYATSGGTLKDVTVHEHGTIGLDDATGSNFTIMDGDVELRNGGKLINATMFNTDLSVYSGSIASKITAEKSCDIYLMESGAKVNGVTVKEDTTLHVFEGTVASNVTAEYRGRVFVRGTITGLTIGSGTSIGLDEFATATKVKWTPGDGNFTIYDGASVKYTSKYSGVYVGAAGSHVSRTNVFEDSLAMGDSAYVAKGGSAKGVEIGGGGIMEVWSGGKATDTVIKGGCSMTVSAGGTAYDTEVNGDLYLRGGSASGVRIEKNGCLHIASGTATAVEWTPFVGRLALGENAHVTFADDTTGVYTGPDKWAENVEGITLAKNTDSMYVMSGGYADNTRIGSGRMYVYGGSVNNTVFTNDLSLDMGLMDLYDNASATNTVLKCGTIHVYSGAVIEHTTLAPLGSIFIHSCGSAVDTTLEKGCVYVSRGGYADVVKVMNGNFTVLDGGTVNHVSACSGSYMDAGKIRVSSGAVLSSLVLERGSYLYVEKGAKVVNVTSGYGSVIVSEKGATIKNVTKGTEFESEDSDGDGKNGNGWKNKAKKTVYDSLLDSNATEIDNHTIQIKFDEKEMKNFNRNNFVGYGDEIDFIKIRLDVPAELSFTIMATDAAKFTVWRWDDKKEKMVSLQSTTLKDLTGAPAESGKDFRAETKAFLLTDTEDYYLSVEATNASKGAYVYYDVYLNDDESTFYNKGDHSDDWTDLADNGPNSTMYGDVGVISGVDDPLVEGNWVGFDDGIDYMTFMVKDDVSMSFSITADDAVKFTVFSIYDDEDGWNTATLLTKTVKPKKAGTDKTEFTAECQFVADNEKTYFFSVEYLNKKNVGSGANYSVYVETYDLLTVPDGDIIDDPGFIDEQPFELVDLFEVGGDSNGCALDMPESDDLTMTDSLNFGQYDTDALADASASALADLDGKSFWQDTLLA